MAFKFRKHVWNEMQKMSKCDVLWFSKFHVYPSHNSCSTKCSFYCLSSPLCSKIPFISNETLIWNSFYSFLFLFLPFFFFLSFYLFSFFFFLFLFFSFSFFANATWFYGEWISKGGKVGELFLKKWSKMKQNKNKRA